MWKRQNTENPIDTAIHYVQLMREKNINRKKLAITLNVSYDKLKALISLIKLDVEIQDGIRYNLISVNHAKQIMRLKELDKQITLYRFSIIQEYSCRDLKFIVDDVISKKNTKNFDTYLFNGNLRYRKNNKIKQRNKISTVTS